MSTLALLIEAIDALDVNELSRLGDAVAKQGNNLDPTYTWTFKVESQARTARPRYKTGGLPYWMKHVTGFNPRKLGSGFAFEGDFLNRTKLASLGDGQLVLLASKDTVHPYYSLCAVDKGYHTTFMGTTFDGLLMLAGGDCDDASLSERDRKVRAMQPVMDYLEDSYPSMRVSSS